MESGPILPPGFEALENLIAHWVLEDSVARSARRQASTLEQLRLFYDAMLPYTDRATDYLKGFAMGSMAPEGERLLKLMLSLAEVAPAIEWYNSPRVYDGFDIRRVRIAMQISDTAAQN